MSEADLWVFGYGSLMWRPGFAFVEQVPARIRGYHRSLCVYSFVHRGTRERPGLVLGLDRGGGCIGIAFRVEADKAKETVAYLREREQVTKVYVETRLATRLQDGRHVSALAYRVDRSHQQYAGRLDFDQTAKFVAQGFGVSGVNADYVRETHRLLIGLGIVDPVLSALDRHFRSGEASEIGRRAP